MLMYCVQYIRSVQTEMHINKYCTEKIYGVFFSRFKKLPMLLPADPIMSSATRNIQLININHTWVMVGTLTHIYARELVFEFTISIITSNCSQYIRTENLSEFIRINYLFIFFKNFRSILPSENEKKKLVLLDTCVPKYLFAF